MQKLILCDTSCLILLTKLDLLDVLKELYGEVTITTAIANEFGEELPDFIRIENPKNDNYQRILTTTLDVGEASAIALCIEKQNSFLLVDDLKARNKAKQLDLSFTGTIGILIAASEKGIIPDMRLIIEKIKQSNFRISEKYLIELVRRAKR